MQTRHWPLGDLDLLAVASGNLQVIVTSCDTNNYRFLSLTVSPCRAPCVYAMNSPMIIITIINNFWYAA